MGVYDNILNMKNNEQRINNIIGQLEGLKKMLDKKEDCLKVLTQVKAARSALSSLARNLISEELDLCLKTRRIKNNRGKIEKIIQEILKNN